MLRSWEVTTKNMDYSFKKFSRDEVPQITNLLKECFIFKSKDKELAVRWKYDYQAFPRQLFFYGVWDRNGKLVSQYANLENNLVCEKKIIKGLTCFDMATHPNYRGRGLISQLSRRVYEDVQKSEFEVSFGYSNDQGIKVDKYSTGYGYTVVGKFAKYLKPVLFPQPSRFTFHEISSFPDSYKPFSDNFLRINKPRNYLVWRYNDRPGNTYKIFEIETPEHKLGYVVLRLHDIRVDLMDIIGLSIKDYGEIFKGVEKLTKRPHRMFIVINVLENTTWKDIFKKEGFTYQPGKSHSYLTVKIHKKGEGWRNEILDKEKWILMGGDIW